MIHILQKHLARYPKMQLQDMAKLIYQSEFGGGHLIANPEHSLNRIWKEYETVYEEKRVFPQDVEMIGGGMCRVYLSVMEHGMRPEVLNEMFVQSANHVRGSVQQLEEKLQTLVDACEDGLLPFAKEEAEAFWKAWEQKGYPAMSHSEIYRENYYPAYRVMEASYVKVYEVIQQIEKCKKESCTVAIDGMCGSGKTTLGNLLKKNYPESNLFHVDDYFLQPHQRTEKRLAEIGGNLDYERMKEEIVDHLSDKNGLHYREYDCGTQSLGKEIYVKWSPLTIVEGAYSQHPYFGEVYDIRVFCEVEKKEQLKRIRKRNGEKMLKRFQEEWIPRENLYFETYGIKEKSGLQ